MHVGVDEAGKGPVLGSMFAAAVRADPDALPEDVADSKRLAPTTRERIAAALREDPTVTVGVAEIPPERIDDPATDMNTLTVAAQAAALSQVAAEGDVTVLDAGDTDERRFGARVADRVDVDLSLSAEHRADDTYPIVAAASVVAKVERDAHVARLAAEYDADLGSGYPSDETTVAFLEEYLEATGELPACARRSWATSERLLAERAQSGLDEF